MEESEPTIGPVSEAMGVTRLWLLGSDAPLPESIDLPVSLLVELMDAAEALYPTEGQRWRQLRQWLSRLTGRPVSEFTDALPVLTAVRRQYRSSRDEDLQAVTVWRRAQPRPADVSQVQLTVRPENAARLRRLAQQLGSEEAAIEFLLQMDDNCGKGAAVRRTRWPPKVHYESARGQVKIDVGTEMVCVVLSQFKPSPTTRADPPVVVVPTVPPASEAPADPGRTEDSTEEQIHVNGQTVDTTPAAAPAPAVAARPADGAPPAPLSLGSGYGAVVRDATLPAQMFADDDLAPDQLADVQDQLTSVLDRLAAGDDSSLASSVVDGGDGKVAVEETVSAGGEAGEPGEESSATPGEESCSLPEPESPSAAAGGMEEGGGEASPMNQLGVVTEQMVTAEQMGVVSEEMGVVSEEMGVVSEEMGVVGEDMGVVGEDMGVVGEEMGVVSEEMEVVSKPLSGEPADAEELAVAAEEVATDKEDSRQEMLSDMEPPEQLVELPGQLMTSEEESAAVVEDMELAQEVVMAPEV